MATLSCKAYRSLLSNPKASRISRPFCTSSSENHDLDEPTSNLDTPPQSQAAKEREVYDRLLEHSLDVGIYGEILVGRVRQSPLHKRLKGGTTMTMLSMGIGGIRSNKRPLDHKDPKDYENRCVVQWHKFSVYRSRLGDLLIKHVVPGAIFVCGV